MWSCLNTTACQVSLVYVANCTPTSADPAPSAIIRDRIWGNKCCFNFGMKSYHNEISTIVQLSSHLATLTAGSPACLWTNKPICSGSFWVMPMEWWTSGQIENFSFWGRWCPSFRVRIRRMRAWRRSIWVICFTNCLRSVLEYLAFNVQCFRLPVHPKPQSILRRCG